MIAMYSVCRVFVLLFAFFLFVFNLDTFAQSTTSDTKITALEKSHGLNNRVRTAIKDKAQPELILMLADSAVRLLERDKNAHPEAYATAIFLKARRLRRNGEYQLALRSLELAKGLSGIADSTLGYIAEEKARAYMKVTNFLPALEHLEAAIIYFKTVDLRFRWATVNYLKGSYFKELNRIPDAIKAYQEGLAMFEELNQKAKGDTLLSYDSYILTVRMALIQSYAKAGEFDRAFHEAQLGLSREDWEGFYRQKALLHAAEGRAYELKANTFLRNDSIRRASLKAARHAHQNALETFDVAGINDNNVLRSYLNLGVAWEEDKEFQKAIEVYERGLGWAEKEDREFDQSLVNTLYIRLGESHISLGQNNKALNVLQRIKGLPADTDLKAMEGLVLTPASLVLQNDALTNRKQMEYFRLISVLLGLIFIVGMIFSYRRRDRAIKKQKLLFEQTQIELNQQIRIEAQRKIVADIGDMIHRDRCAEILACAFKVNVWKMEKEIDSNYAIDIPDLEELRLDIVGVNDRLRAMTEELKSLEQVIESKNLQELAHIVINRFRSYRFKVDFRSFQIDDKEFPIYIKHNMYCIMGEAMKNIVGSKEVKKVSLQLIYTAEPEELSLTIVDDGIGFDPQYMTPGNGIQNMKKYAKEMGTELQINSKPNPHTTVHCAVAGPFENQNEGPNRNFKSL